MKKKTLFAVACLLTVTAIGVANVAAAETINTDPKQRLPDPDTKPPAIGKPIKVFILLGQSNMLGFGRINPDTTKGTLAHLTRKEGKYPHLVDDEGNWTVRDDVWYVKVTVGQNLVCLIKTLRKEFNAPKAPFVLATIAFGGWDLKGP